MNTPRIDPDSRSDTDGPGTDGGGKVSGPETEPTRTARARYDRIAGVYDVFEGVMEGLVYRRWRTLAWRHVEGDPILEIGVGTGKNLPFHPRDRDIAAMDLSRRMMSKAIRKARGRRNVHFGQMDAQALPFADATFDTVIATFVFCSVPDPILGLREAWRVLRPGGRLVLLEHVLSGVPLLRPLMRLLNPIFVTLTGANISRETVENVWQSGFEMDELWDLGVADIYKLVVARKPTG